MRFLAVRSWLRDAFDNERSVATTHMIMSQRNYHVWAYLIGFSPILLTIWLVNGAFSVQGIPYFISLVTSTSLTQFPEWLLTTLMYTGWFLVIATSALEINLFSRGIPGSAGWYAVSYERWGLSAIAMGYDFITTAGGLYGWLLPKLGTTIPSIAVAIILAIIFTPATEIIVSFIRRLK